LDTERKKIDSFHPKRLFDHKSFLAACVFALWVWVAFIVTFIDSNNDKGNEKLAKSKWFQLVSVLLSCLYAAWYAFDRFRER